MSIFESSARVSQRGREVTKVVGVSAAALALAACGTSTADNNKQKVAGYAQELNCKAHVYDGEPNRIFASVHTGEQGLGSTPIRRIYLSLPNKPEQISAPAKLRFNEDQYVAKLLFPKDYTELYIQVRVAGHEELIACPTIRPDHSDVASGQG